MAHKPVGGSVAGIQGQSLQINIVGCRNLTDKEWFSRQDPYVTIEYANNRFRTRTDTDGGKNPMFNEKFTIPLIEGLREVNVSVWNSNTVSLDDFIGSARVLLDKVLSTGYDDTSWTLKSKHGKTSGDVSLILHYANSTTSKIGKEDKLHGASSGYGAAAYPAAHGAPGGYPPSGYPPSGYPPAAAHGAPSGYPPAAPHGAPAGYPPAPHGAPAGYPPSHGGSSGYPPSYAAAPTPGYPPAPSYGGGYPPAGGGYPPPAAGYPPAPSSHGGSYPGQGYPPAPGHAPGHAPFPAPGGYPGAPPPVYGVPPGMHKPGKAGKVHVGSSGHYKHGKHGKHGKPKKYKFKGPKIFGMKFKGWKGWKGKK